MGVGAGILRAPWRSGENALQLCTHVRGFFFNDFHFGSFTGEDAVTENRLSVDIADAFAVDAAFYKFNLCHINLRMLDSGRCRNCRGCR